MVFSSIEYSLFGNIYLKMQMEADSISTLNEFTYQRPIGAYKPHF